MQILNCSQYYNPLTTPYSCITFLDSLAILGIIIVVLIIGIIIYEKTKK